MTIKKHSLRNKQCTAIVDYSNLFPIILTMNRNQLTIKTMLPKLF